MVDFGYLIARLVKGAYHRADGCKKGGSGFILLRNDKLFV